MYAGMWQLAKRILPNTALERILFPTKPELLQFFEEEHLLVGAFALCNDLRTDVFLYRARRYRRVHLHAREPDT